MRWALQKDHKDDSTPTTQIFVGGLASDVNDKLLLRGFLPFGCTDARVMWDHNTGQTKGYGFVSFRQDLRFPVSTVVFFIVASDALQELPLFCEHCQNLL